MDYTKDWADCDDICSNVLGEYFLKFPDEAICVLDWARSENLWYRRAAAVSLLKPLRKETQFHLAETVAALLLQDQEDLVQKGYGWMLKEASKKWPEEVLSFLSQHSSIMPRTAYRYALEKYPSEIKREMMQR
jgi:3-methyladenine DNA glycosylase AlkD